MSQEVFLKLFIWNGNEALLQLLIWHEKEEVFDLLNSSCTYIDKYALVCIPL